MGDWWLSPTFDAAIKAHSPKGPNVSTSAVKVAALQAPAAAGAGARAFVSDANAATWGTVVAGGGTNMVPVFSDGTAWKIG